MPALPYCDLINNVTHHNALIKARPASDCVIDYNRFTLPHTVILHIGNNQITEAVLGGSFGASPNKAAARYSGERKMFGDLDYTTR